MNSGGAIHLTHTRAPDTPIGIVINNTKFIGNYAKSGGAILFDQIQKFLPSLNILENLYFEKNNALTENGGALLLESISQKMNIKNISLVENHAKIYGGTFFFLNFFKIDFFFPIGGIFGKYIQGLDF